MMEYADCIASWIRKIDKRLSGPADHGKDEALVESVVSVFSDIDGIKRGLDTYRGRVYIGGMSSDDYTDYRGDLEKLKGKLEWHMVREGMQRTASSPSEAAPSVNVEFKPTVSASSSSNADAAATSNSATNVLGSIEADDKLPKDAERRKVAKPLKKYMKEKFQNRHIPYILLHHDSASDMNLQVADYFCWAAQRDLAQGKTWPMTLVCDRFARVGRVSFK